MAAVSPQMSILVATRDRAAQLERFLVALPAAEITAAAAEVVMLDNGSSDATAALLAGWAATAPFPARVLHDPRPGKSAALNAAVAHCRGDLLVFTDDDCYLAPGYLAAVQRAFADPVLGWAGGRILRHDAGASRIATNASRWRRRFAPGSFLRAGLVQGANMVFTRRAFLAAGGFDPEFGPGLRFRCEDIDLVARASHAGFTGAYLPELLVYHDHGRQPGAATAALRRQNWHGRGAYYAKCLQRGQYRFLFGWLLRSAAPWRWVAIPHELRGAREYRASRPRRDA
jgi:GT2 family glycosyltransferase